MKLELGFWQRSFVMLDSYGQLTIRRYEDAKEQATLVAHETEITALLVDLKHSLIVTASNDSVVGRRLSVRFRSKGSTGRRNQRYLEKWSMLIMRPKWLYFPSLLFITSSFRSLLTRWSLCGTMSTSRLSQQAWLLEVKSHPFNGLNLMGSSLHLMQLVLSRYGVLQALSLISAYWNSL